MGNVATRLISIIFILQSKASVKAAELAEELGVSERTIHRYMGMLDELGIPIYSERGPYGGFSLVRGYKLPPLIFTAEEATVLYLGANLIKEVWGKSYRDAASSATAKLDNVLPDELLQEVSRAQEALVVTGLHRFDYSPWERFIDDLRRCVEDQRQVRLIYYALSRQETTEREVDPYALVHQWGVWYLVGHCHLRGEMRTFRVDRIQALTPLEIPFVRPADFSVKEYMARSFEPPEPVYEIKVRFDPQVAPFVKEEHADWQHLTENPDGSVTVTFMSSELDWPASFVLRYGEAATVIQPPELVEKVKATAQAIVASYKSPSEN
jgi:predicted DNA-binding transcriptional regulator YafY